MIDALRKGKCPFARPYRVCAQRSAFAPYIGVFSVHTHVENSSNNILLMSFRPSEQRERAEKSRLIDRFLHFGAPRFSCGVRTTPPSGTANADVGVCSPRAAKQWVSTVLKTLHSPVEMTNKGKSPHLVEMTGDMQSAPRINARGAFFSV